MYLEESLAAATRAESRIVTFVMDLVPLLEPAEDGDRVLDRRLADHDGLEPALEGGVLLDVLAVFVQGGRADATQLAPGQGRLQEIGRVHRPVGLPGPDDQVQLVDEEDDLAVRLGDVAEHGLEPFLELAAELGPGDQRPHVEGDQLAALERLGHVAGEDPLGQPLDDGGLADPRLTDQDRVVLRPPAQDLDHAADLGVAPDHRVHLALTRHLDQVAAVLLQGLVLVLGIVLGDLAPSAHLGDGRPDVLLADAEGAEEILGLARDRGQPEQEVLDRGVFVPHPLGLGERRLEHPAEVGAHVQLAAADFREGVESLVGRPGDPGRVDAEAPQHVPDDGLIRVEERRQEMHRLDPLMAAPGRHLLRLLDRLLTFHGEFFEPECHIFPLRSSNPPRAVMLTTMTVTRVCSCITPIPYRSFEVDA